MYKVLILAACVMFRFKPATEGLHAIVIPYHDDNITTLNTTLRYPKDLNTFAANFPTLVETIYFH